ncbi:MAG: single-strand DNA-binding protein [bacterium P3]|nr:MAG: single-strand DNA-binding protein [bacterium P3]KWW41012.1 MAG: single-strand DNA-binding protein [bacterium F083]
MIGVNKVILIGNVGRNPDVVSFPQDRHGEIQGVVKKASFTLATTEYHRNREGLRIEQTEWHNVVCWRSLAEIAEKILRKGVTVYVEGRLQTRSWEDKEGNKRYITEVVADNFTVLTGRTRGEESSAGGQRAPFADTRDNPLEEILTADTEPLGDLPF